jgi:hypothetical protein
MISFLLLFSRFSLTFDSLTMMVFFFFFGLFYLEFVKVFGGADQCSSPNLGSFKPKYLFQIFCPPPPIFSVTTIRCVLVLAMMSHWPLTLCSFFFSLYFPHN